MLVVLVRKEPKDQRAEPDLRAIKEQPEERAHRGTRVRREIQVEAVLKETKALRAILVPVVLRGTKELLAGRGLREIKGLKEIPEELDLRAPKVTPGVLALRVTRAHKGIKGNPVQRKYLLNGQRRPSAPPPRSQLRTDRQSHPSQRRGTSPTPPYHSSLLGETASSSSFGMITGRVR
jgi:hypothetical protein